MEESLWQRAEFYMMLKFISHAVLTGVHGLYTRCGREEELDSPIRSIGTEQRSYFAQKEIAGAAAVSEDINVD
jgi:hypothetical protein